MNTDPAVVPPPVPVSPDFRAAAWAVGLTAIGDFLLWPARPGLSAAIFAVVLGAVMLLLRWQAGRCRGRLLVGMAALGVSAGATALELSFSNLLVLLGLLLWLVGETAFPQLRAGWPRWSEAAWTLLKAPGQLWWLQRALRRGLLKRARMGRAAYFFLSVVLPVLVVAWVFGMLLTAGNAILDAWLAAAAEWIAAWMPDLPLSFGRIVFWLALAAFAAFLLRPGRAQEHQRFWTGSISTLPEPTDPRLSWLRSALVLALLNALYFAANTIDALFLWTHAHLPAGVTYSGYVHQGVNSLVAAVLLSALVLVLVFQQARSVADSRGLKALGLLWIAQNAMLIVSVLLRLERYVEVYELTTLRVYAGCFLLLVTAGFAALAGYILRRKSLNWLLLQNALATCALFFCLQFADVARWVADANVASWQRQMGHGLDLGYLDSLGSAAWPGLIVVAQTQNRVESWDARAKLRAHRAAAQAMLQVANWRSWQYRDSHRAAELLRYLDRTGE